MSFKATVAGTAHEPLLNCPNCNYEIRLTESLAAPLLAETRQRFQEQLASKDAEVARKSEELSQQREQLAKDRETLDDQVKQRLAAERSQLVAAEAKKAREAAAAELKAKADETAELRQALEANNLKLAEAQQAQAELMRKQRALDEEKRELDLTIEKRVQASVDQIHAKARQEADEAARLRVAEKDQTIESMTRTIEELKRKAEQGSQQSQGEVLELELEELLKSRFPMDVIEPVGKGELGADMIQQVNGQLPLLKWSASIPAILGGFPANALLFRRGYVKQGEPVVHEERALKSIWARETPLIAEDPSFDPNRDKVQSATPKAGEKVTAVDPLAFLVGPVEVKYDGDPAKSRIIDLAPFIDHDKKRIKSITGEVVLDYNIGLCTVDTPKAQGACGYLAKSELIKLSTLAVRSANTYATILAVALDDQPLATSKRILIQVGTANRPTGWVANPAEFQTPDKRKIQGYEVKNTGASPWRIASAEFGISLKNPGLSKATLVNSAGYAIEDVVLTRVKSGISMNLPTDTMYLILE